MIESSLVEASIVSRGMYLDDVNKTRFGVHEVLAELSEIAVATGVACTLKKIDAELAPFTSPVAESLRLANKHTGLTSGAIAKIALSDTNSLKIKAWQGHSEGV
jgi:hypothetical protein